MPTFIKSLTFDCGDALIAATFWASVLGSNVDEESTSDKAYVEAPGWGGPNMWFNRVPEGKVARTGSTWTCELLGRSTTRFSG